MIPRKKPWKKTTPYLKAAMSCRSAWRMWCAFKDWRRGFGNPGVRCPYQEKLNFSTAPRRYCTCSDLLHSIFFRCICLARCIGSVGLPACASWALGWTHRALYLSKTWTTDASWSGFEAFVQLTFDRYIFFIQLTYLHTLLPNYLHMTCTKIVGVDHCTPTVPPQGMVQLTGLVTILVLMLSIGQVQSCLWVHETWQKGSVS